MKYRIVTIIISFLFLIAVATVGKSASAQEWPECGETTVPACLVAGQMCILTLDGDPPYKRCGAGSLTYQSTDLSEDSLVGRVIGGVNASGIYGYFQSNVEWLEDRNPYLCLGSQAYCSTFPYSNNIWSASASNPANFVKVNDWDYGFNGLRPGRSYVFTKAESDTTYPGLFAVGQSPLLTTWPGYGFTPTNKNTDSGCVGGVCGRDISWTTPFPGDSEVKYGINSPSWALETNPKDVTTNISSLTSTANGHVWGVGWYAGKIIHRDPNGTWAPQVSPTINTLMSVSSADGVHAWAVGQFGTVISTQNSGLNWVTTPSFTARSFTNVFATTATTAWATDDQNVYFFDGSSWRLKLTDPTANFQQVISIDNHEVWVVSYNGTVRHTTNGYQDWVSATPPIWDTITVSPNDRYLSISTLDGQTLWLGGNNATSGLPVLYRSQNGGPWVSIPQIVSVTARVENINQIDQDTFWFSNLSGVGKFNYNGGAPIIDYYNQPGAQIGSTVLALAVDKGNNILAAGQEQNISRYTLRNTTTLSDASLTTTHALTLTPSLNPLLPATTYYFSAESTGSGVSSGALGSFTTPVLENVPPTVAMNTPTPGTWYFRDYPITFTGTATDAAMNNVRLEFKYTGDTWGAPTADQHSWPAVLDGAGNWTATIPPSAFKDPQVGFCGSCGGCCPFPAHSDYSDYDTLFNVKAVATDDSGNTAETSVDNFLLDPFPETPQIFCMAGDYGCSNFVLPATTDRTAVTFHVTCDGVGSSGLANMEVGLDSSWTSVGVVYDGNGLETAVTLTKPNEVQYIGLRCTDHAGNVSSVYHWITYAPPVQDFTIDAVPPATETIVAGQSHTFNVKSDALGGFNGLVNLAVELPADAPDGMTATLGAPLIDFSGGQTTDTVTLTVNTQAGAAHDQVGIKVRGTSGALAQKEATFGITLTATPPTPTFTISCSVDCIQTVVAGQSATYAIDIAAQNGFSGAITLTTPLILPGGMTASIVPTPIVFVNGVLFSPPPVLTVTTPAGAATGFLGIPITGNSGAINKTTTVQLSRTATPPEPDFTLTCSGLCTKAIAAGGTTTYQMNVTGAADYVYGAINWTTGALPAGVTATFGALSGSPTAGGTGVVTLTVNAAVAVTTTTIDVTADDGNYQHTVAVGIGPAQDFNMVVTPVDSTVTAGSQERATYNIQLTAINGFNRSVHLDFESNPQDLVNIVPTFGQEDVVPMPGGVSVTLNIEVKSPYQDTTPQVALQITGLAQAAPGFPAIQKTDADNMDVSPDQTAPEISNEVASVSDQNATITWLTDEPANSMVTVYSDEDQTSIVDISSTPDYCLAADCHSIVTGALNSSTTYYYAITSVDQAFPVPNSGEKLENGIVPLQFTTSAAPDDEAPQVQIIQPVNNDTISGTNNINVTASDNNVMASLRLEIAPAVANENLFRVDTTTLCPGTLSCDMNPIFTWDTLATTPNDTYTITVTALSTTGPAISASTSINVTVYNDRQPPKVIGNPTSSDLDCTGPMGTCSIMINWKTDAPSTSEVEYGLAVDCEGVRTLPDNTVVACAYTDSELGNYVDAVTSPDLSATFTAHSVELTGLLPNRLYHYRITSCTNNLYCTN